MYMHLYTSMRKIEKCHKFLFVNPFRISCKKNSSLEEMARVLASRLLTSTSDQLVLVPCNVGKLFKYYICLKHHYSFIFNLHFNYFHF